MVKFLTKKHDKERKKIPISLAVLYYENCKNPITSPEFNSFAINSGFVFCFQRTHTTICQ